MRAVKGAMTVPAIALRLAPAKEVLAKGAVVKEAAAVTGAIRTRGATAQETAVTEATVRAETTVAMDDVTGETATIDSVETTAVDGDDATEDSVGTGEEVSARSRLHLSQSSASLHRTLRPSPTSKTARAA